MKMMKQKLLLTLLPILQQLVKEQKTLLTSVITMNQFPTQTLVIILLRPQRQS